jgi:NAD(P)-dependent dehydrogenase (short-subunit alcohol dehydrogenase family)
MPMSSSSDAAATPASGALAGHHVLVTGGASGIGRACAERYRAEGATVYVADLHPSSSDEILLDVSDPAAWAALADSLPPLDMVHLNAGIVTPDRQSLFSDVTVPLSDVSDDAYRAIMGVNLDGVFFGVRAVLPKMIEHGGGQILVTASMAGLAGMPGDVAYTATKHAVVGLVRSLGATLDAHGVCISAICPGFVATPLVPEDARAKTILNLDPPDHTRLRRLVSARRSPRPPSSGCGRAIERWSTTVLDVAAERGTIELIDDLAFPVPFQVISELLDMPTERADELRDWSQALTATLEPTRRSRLDAADRARRSCSSSPTSSRSSSTAAPTPATTCCRALIAVEEDGDRLSPAELISFVVLLYVAGHETTVNLIGNGVLALLRHPDELAAGATTRRSTPRRSTSCSASTVRSSTPPVSR